MPAGSTADGSPNSPSKDNDASHDPTLQQEVRETIFIAKALTHDTEVIAT